MEAMLKAVSVSLCAWLGLAAAADAQQPHRWSLVVHGGAGAVERTQMDDEMEAQYRASMAVALERGAAVLDAGGSSLDAVEAVIAGLEDDPLFNAGRGAVFGADGQNHLDAAIMDGRNRAAGAVADVTRTRHPIRLARAIMEHSPHVLLVGEGAEVFGQTQGLERVDRAFFFTERRWQQLVRDLQRRNLPVPERPAVAPPASGSSDETNTDDHRFGTVGVVAFDTRGDLAAGTSTGGTSAKLWGRVGDTPVIGAGTYAQNGVCAVSATGVGEYFIRASVARTICARMELLQESAEQASRAVIAELDTMGGAGGVIVMDGQGRGMWRFNTQGMYRARLEQGGVPVISMFGDEQ